jgi:group I intron endonuclease
MSTSSKEFPIVYFNPEREKESIIKENKGKSGIYRWVHIESGNSYIGSSVRLNNRFKQYFNYNHLTSLDRNMRINKALLKYGHSGFRFEILEYCSVEELIKREQFYFDKYQPKYNLLKVAGSTLGHQHSEASKILIGLASKNRKVSEISRELRSKALLGLKLSKEHVNNLSKSNTFTQPVLLTNTETGDTKEFPSMTDAGKYLGTSRVQIRNYLIKDAPFKNYLISKVFTGENKKVEHLSTSKVQQQSLLLTNTETGETKKFSSITETAKYLEVSRGRIWYYFNKNVSSGASEIAPFTIKGYKFTKITYNDDSSEVIVNRATKRLDITDIMTNVTSTYSSFTSAGKALGVRQSSISGYLKKNTPNLFKGRYIIKLI